MSEIIKIIDKSQQEAIDKITLKDRLYLLTGAGGSGKTFTLEHLLLKLWGEGLDPVRTFLAAPTGRAAKVISDAMILSGMVHLENQPSTIHSTFDYNPAFGGFQYNKNNKLPASLVIIDESSMVDSELLFRVIDAIPPDCCLLLVGDVNQLPPVGPGAPFYDLITYGNQSVVSRLTTNHRQTQGSLIADACLRILDGKKILWGERGKHSLGGELEDDLFFQENDDKEDIPQSILTICQPWHDAGLDYTILAPQHNGVCGVTAINKFLQEKLNPSDTDKEEIKIGFDTILRVGDKVIQTKNNYHLDVFNGYTGLIIDIDRGAKTIIVDFDGQEVIYSDPDHLKQLSLGYCMTIHKAQGSQYQYGVVVCHSSHYWSWSRGLLYTSISRFRKELHVIGDEKAVKRGLSNVDDKKRNTYLKLYLIASGGEV